MNTIFKITSKKRGGGGGILAYLDERTKNASIPLNNLEIQPVSALLAYDPAEAEKVFLEKAENLRRPRRPQFVRAVISLSNEYEMELRKKKLKPSRCLTHIADELLSEYSDKICGRPDGLFCFRGTHLGTDNIHVHIAFLTETINGKYAPTTTAKLNENNEKHPDYFLFLRERTEEISKQALDSPFISFYDDEELLREAKRKKLEEVIKAYEKGNRIAFLLAYKRATAKAKRDSGELIAQRGAGVSAGEGLGEGQTISVGGE